jgi:hypothetical protein
MTPTPTPLPEPAGGPDRPASPGAPGGGPYGDRPARPPADGTDGPGPDTGRSGAPGPGRSAAHRLIGEHTLARVVGTALVVAAGDPVAAFHGPGINTAALVTAAAAAWWWAPMNDTRPARTSMRWYRIAALRSNTVLAAGAVVLAAVTGPGPWAQACVAALLVAYLLITDQWTRGATAPRRTRSAGPAVAASAAVAVVFLAARLPVPGTDWARLPAVVVLSAAACCLAVALLRGGGPRA